MVSCCSHAIKCCMADPCYGEQPGGITAIETYQPRTGRRTAGALRRLETCCRFSVGIRNEWYTRGGSRPDGWGCDQPPAQIDSGEAAWDDASSWPVGPSFRSWIIGSIRHHHQHRRVAEAMRLAHLVSTQLYPTERLSSGQGVSMSAWYLIQ